MKKFLMLSLLALFASTSLFGQANLNFAESSSQNTVFKRAGFSKLRIGDEKFSFARADEFLADAEVARRLKSGLRLEKLAIGFGVGGVVAFGGAWAAFDLMGRDNQYDDGNSTASVVLGILLIDTGLALGLTAIALGTIGTVKISKTIKGYNNQSPVTLGLAPTPGGMGLQLTF
jgi:hypothetical protein